MSDTKTVTKYIIPVFIKAVLFHHVVMPWSIQTKEQINFSVDDFFFGVNMVHGIIKVCLNLHGPFLYFLETAHQYSYELMCGLKSYDKMHETTS